MRIGRSLAWAALAAFGGLGLAPRAAGQALVLRYQLIELVGPGGGQSKAYAVNNTGQVIGWATDGDRRHSVQWHNRVTVDLHGTVHFELLHPIPLFTEDFGQAFDISDADQVIGTARTLIRCEEVTPTISNAFLLRPAVLTDLATPFPGDALSNLGTFGDPCWQHDSAAIGISNTNYVVGWADQYGELIRAFLVRPVGGNFVVLDPLTAANLLLIDLGTLAASDPVSSATAVNDAGQVTGWSYTFGPDGHAAYHAFLLTPLDTDVDGEPDAWSTAGPDGVNPLMQDLGTLGGTNSWGRDINNTGVVVGEADMAGAGGRHFTRAFMSDGAVMTDLGALQTDAAGGFSSAAAINEHGVVVGWAENNNRQRRAFVWQNGEMQDLNSLLYLVDEDGNAVSPSIVLTEARDINDDGIIVGWGDVRGTAGTQQCAFLLNPVLVDPAALEPDDGETPPEDPGDDSPPRDNGSDAYTSDAVFGTPDHLVNDPNTDGGDAVDDTNPRPTVCGMGVVTALPLTLAGLVWGKRRRYPSHAA